MRSKSPFSKPKPTKILLFHVKIFDDEQLYAIGTRSKFIRAYKENFVRTLSLFRSAIYLHLSPFHWLPDVALPKCRWSHVIFIEI